MELCFWWAECLKIEFQKINTGTIEFKIIIQISRIDLQKNLNNQKSNFQKLDFKKLKFQKNLWIKIELKN